MALSRFIRVGNHSTDKWCNTKETLLLVCSEENKKYTD